MPPRNFEATIDPSGTATLRLLSGDGQNRISIDLLRSLAEWPAANPAATKIILRGNAGCFSVGADLNLIRELDPPTAWSLARQGQHWLTRIAQSRVPFIALVEGYCLGGGLDLALACRTRLCAPGAYFGHHGAKLGLVTGWGGTQRLPRLIGPSLALEHLLAARGWTAEQAVEEGLAQWLT
ncbi:MAG TPA: enoyl-CoA hydratase/isomerase family protein [Terriglobales bacterium]|nr:enoyl-CoA hydratase/isomerase family protein [Terriglobales bacterium]